MAKCNECWHKNICRRLQFPSLYGLIGDYCDEFKPKSRFVELPIKATDELKSELEKYCFERCVDEL